MLLWDIAHLREKTFVTRLVILVEEKNCIATIYLINACKILDLSRPGVKHLANTIFQSQLLFILIVNSLQISACRFKSLNCSEYDLD